MKRALFLDRDGIINIEKNYLYKIQDFEFMDGIFELCHFFQNHGYLIIVITNQAGIARGYYTEEDFISLTDWMRCQFKKRNIDITEVYYCPHHPDFTGECVCRKPNPGLLLKAADDYDINLQQSVFFGDKISDVEAGDNAGVGVNVLLKDISSALSILIGFDTTKG